MSVCGRRQLRGYIIGRGDRLRGKFQWSGNRGDYSCSGVGHNTQARGVDGTRSHQTDIRTPMGWTQMPSIGGGVASGPKSGDDRYEPRPQGIQCYNCGQMGHTRRECPRGQQRNLNGIGGTNTAPPSYP